MTPVKASGWFKTELSADYRKALVFTGVVPVNDVFYDLWGNRNKITLLYGGYGSGKSVFIQTLLLDLCRQPGYFKCYYGRKIKEDVRGSVHSKFITLIKDLGLEDEFQYSEQPNGSMVIRHVQTGNSFHEFGANNAESLKSIDDPTHFFLEEMDQFTAEDFGVIISRLRTKKADTQLYGAFNTAMVFPGHWIKKTFFKENDGEKLEEAEQLLIDVLQHFGVHKLFCNYTDNYFIDQDDYYNKLVIAAAGDMHALQASAKGEWGSHKPKSPAFTQYRPSLHENRECKHIPGKQIRIVIDFNLNPFSAFVCHIWEDAQGQHFHIFDQFEITQGSIPKLCDQIRTKYWRYLPSCLITGDAMGNRGDISQRDNATLYKQIQLLLKLSPEQFKVKGNPRQSNSLEDCNYFLYHFPDFQVNPQTCPGVCRDLSRVEVDAFGEIKKRNRKDETQLSDYADCFRYAVNTWMKPWILQHQTLSGLR